jgi:glutathione synthase/RimK-type ligase-like ATP-grasp enzyme
MSRVAIVTCEGGDVDPDSPVLLEALGVAGMPGELVNWDDDRVDWGAFDLCVIRSTWNYSSRLEEFLAWAQGVVRLENPYPVIKFSSDKHYLGELARRGHIIVPSTFCDIGSDAVFPEGDFVVKPCVGVGSIDAARYRDNEHAAARHHVATLHESGRDVLIQPYVASVDVVGERALIFVAGKFCHALTKGAMLNTPADERDMLFRRGQMSKAVAEASAVEFAQGVLADLGYSNLLYARVDLVGVDAGWAVMELELVEPSLFLSYDAETTRSLAEAIKRRAINATTRR